ncbi:unnamed protein product [Closterium sp. Naga37s-1]|nr:unnamed protein product [Closterium sp. Naga37s-1]
MQLDPNALVAEEDVDGVTLPNPLSALGVDGEDPRMNGADIDAVIAALQQKKQHLLAAKKASVSRILRQPEVPRGQILPVAPAPVAPSLFQSINAPEGGDYLQSHGGGGVEQGGEGVGSAQMQNLPSYGLPAAALPAAPVLAASVPAAPEVAAAQDLAKMALETYVLLITEAPAQEMLFYPSWEDFQPHLVRKYMRNGVVKDLYYYVNGGNQARADSAMKKVSNKRSNTNKTFKYYGWGAGGYYVDKDKWPALAKEGIIVSEERDVAAWVKHFKHVLYGNHWHCSANGRPFATIAFEKAVCKGFGSSK